MRRRSTRQRARKLGGLAGALLVFAASLGLPGGATAQARVATAPAKLDGQATLAARQEARRLTDRRQYVAALRLFDRLVRENPDDTDLLIEVARVRGFADRNQAAADLYERVLRIAPQRRKDVLMSLAWQSLWAGRLERAAQLFREGSRQRATAVEAARGLAEAQAHLANARVPSGGPEATAGAGRALTPDAQPVAPAVSSRPNEASAPVAPSALGPTRVPPDFQQRREQARGLAAERRFAESVSIYEQLLVAAPDDIDLVVETAQVFGFADANARSADLYLQALRLAPTRRAALLPPLAWQALWSGRLDLAETIFREMVADGAGVFAARDVDDAYRGLVEVLRDSGVIAMRNGNGARGAGLFRAALEVSQRSEALMILLARSLAQADQNMTSVQVYTELFERYPKSRRERLLPYAWQVLWSPQPSEALALFDEALDLGLDRAEALDGRAQACIALDRLDCAIEALERLRALRPQDGDLGVRLARALVWQERHEEARQVYAQVLAAEGGRSDAWTGLAYALNAMGRHREAAAAYARSPRLDDAAVRLDQARALHWAGYPDLALPRLEALDTEAAQAFRESRVRREVLRAASLAVETSTDADRLDSNTTSFSQVWRPSGRMQIELGWRNTRLRGFDQPLADAWGDLVRSDGDGLLQALATRAGAADTALRSGDAAAGLQAFESLFGSTLPDKLSRVLANQRVSGTPGLDGVMAALASPAAQQLRQWLAAGDLAAAQAYATTPDARAFVSNLAQAAARAAQLQPQDAQTVQGRELTTSLSRRWGDVLDPMGTTWTSATIGVRDYAGWQTPVLRLRARHQWGDAWVFDGEFANGVVETLGAIRNRVRQHGLALGAQWTPDPRWQASVGAARLRFDDYNSRSRINWRGEYRMPGTVRVRFALESLRMHNSLPWDDTRNNRGYYNPARSSENKLAVAWEQAVGGGSLQLRAALGRFNETDGFGNTSSGQLRQAEASWVRDLGPRLQLRAALGRSGSATAGSGGGGYWRRYAGIYVTGWY